MKVRVLYFAAAREKAGTNAADIELADDATVAALFEKLAREQPRLGDVLRACRAAVDEEFAPLTTVLRDGQTVGVLPPVSGG